MSLASSVGALTDFSQESAYATTAKAPTKHAPPSKLNMHRTDPRENPKTEDDSVCFDIHWSHHHLKLASHPEDVYFRVTTRYLGEDPLTFCEDAVGVVSRQCGKPIPSVA